MSTASACSTIGRATPCQYSDRPPTRERRPASPAKDLPVVAQGRRKYGSDSGSSQRDSAVGSSFAHR